MTLEPCYSTGQPEDLAKARPHLEAALEHLDGWDLPGVLRAITKGQVLLILCEEGDRVTGAGVVNVETDIAGTKALIVHLFGAEQGSSWVDTFDDLRAFAGTIGCDVVRGFGRAGWARKLGARQTYGWEVDV